MRVSKFILPQLIIVLGCLSTSCATVVSQGNVAVRDTFGAFSEEATGPGLKLFLWPIWDITTIPIRTQNLEVKAPLPSKEGLTIQSEVSILYRVKPELATEVLANAGPSFETEIILPVFRSAIARRERSICCQRYAYKKAGRN